jgi:hypothetical protein
MFIFVPFVRISEGQLMLNDIFFHLEGEARGDPL